MEVDQKPDGVQRTVLREGAGRVISSFPKCLRAFEQVIAAGEAKVTGASHRGLASILMPIDPGTRPVVGAGLPGYRCRTVLCMTGINEGHDGLR